MGPGAGRLVLAAPAAASSGGSPAAGCRPSAHPLEVIAFRLLPERPARRPADPPPGRRAADPAPARPARGRHAGPGTPGARAPASTCTCGPSTTRRDARAARPWRRRPVHRPHRHTQGRARRSAASGGTDGMSDTTSRRSPTSGRSTGPASRRPGTGTTGPTAPSSPRSPASCSRRT